MSRTDSAALAGRIRDLMTRLELTQTALAGLLGVTQPAVSQYLRGRMPPAAVLIRLAHLGDTTVEWLLTGRDPGPEAVQEGAYLSAGERIVLELWDRLGERDRALVLDLMRRLAGESAGARRRRGEGA